MSQHLRRLLRLDNSSGRSSTVVHRNSNKLQRKIYLLSIRSLTYFFTADPYILPPVHSCRAVDDGCRRKIYLLSIRSLTFFSQLPQLLDPVSIPCSADFFTTVHGNSDGYRRKIYLLSIRSLTFSHHQSQLTDTLSLPIALDIPSQLFTEILMRFKVRSRSISS